MKSKNRQEQKQRKSRLLITFEIGGALSAFGILLMQMFVSKEDIAADSMWHILQILFSGAAAVCAVGIAAMVLARQKKEKK